MLRVLVCLICVGCISACAPRYTTSEGAPMQAYLNEGDVRTARVVCRRFASGRPWFRSLVDGLVRAHIR